MKTLSPDLIARFDAVRARVPVADRALLAALADDAAAAAGTGGLERGSEGRKKKEGWKEGGRLPHARRPPQG